MSDDYKALLKQTVFDTQHFVRLTAKGPVRGAPVPWRRIIVRPVELKSGRHLQFSYFDERQDITKNYQGHEAETKLDELLAIPFSSFYVETTSDSLQVQITKKGKPLIHHSKTAQEQRHADLRHNVHKDLPLPADKPDQFLHGLGIMNPQGQINPSMHAKFAQINEFLKLLEHTGELELLEQRPVQILDAGCGSAYLSFAVYHYLNIVRNIEARLIGVDVNRKLIDKSNRLREQLGYPDIAFHAAPIIDYQPDIAPDILLALHACDTATDEALLQGICNSARLILSVPCCHHHLNEQLTAVAPFRPVVQHGILKQRLADILTDTFRAQILRIMGYKTDVVEFISAEHTDRNLMLRAVKRPNVADPRLVREYTELKQFWNVTPYLETLLRERGRWITQD